MRKIPEKDLLAFGTELLKGKGVPPDDAQYIAATACQAEAMGAVTHGVVIFKYFDANIPDVLDPNASPQVVKDFGATAVIDGGRGFSQLAMKKAKELATEKAKSFGIAMIGVNNCLWLGAVGPYLVSLAEDGFLAQLWAQTSTCKDCAPFGGIDARFSTNPLALAFPTGGDPVIADVSTATVALGKVNRWAAGGQKAPEKIFLDKEGKFSDDPKDVLEGGSILFFGGPRYGYKGYALSLWCEALTAVSGGECNNPDTDQRQSFNLTVIDPDALSGRQHYLKEMERFIPHVRGSRPRPGFDKVRLPGERGMSSMRTAAEEGIALGDDLVAQLNAVAVKNGFAEI